MARKVFLSTLGTNPYSDVLYAPVGAEAAPTERTPYIQQARLQALIDAGEQLDKVLICVTDGPMGSKHLNWANRVKGHGSTRELLPDGLESRLRGMKIYDQALLIPTGESEEELWQIFHTLSQAIEPGDTLYVDITHGFRSLPIVLLVALEYLQRAKNVTIAQVTYGAYLPHQPESAPTFDLTPFFVLQKWTAALTLLDSGDFRAIAEIIKPGINAIGALLKWDKRKELDKLPDRLYRLGDCLWVNRLSDLPAAVRDARAALDGSQAALQDLAHQERTELRAILYALKPLNAVLAKLTDKVGTLHADEELEVGFHAAIFCARHGLMAQAFTLAREHWLDILLRRVGLDRVSPRHHLDGFIGAFCGGPPDSNGLTGAVKQAFEDIHLAPHPAMGGSLIYNGAKELIEPICDYRNKLNHAGMDAENGLPPTERLRSRGLQLFQGSLSLLQKYPQLSEPSSS